jgi:adenosine deaminase/aminodeoxyfutalosine deaminase
MTAEDFIRALPKAELHVHLEGSVEPATLRELRPELSEEEIRARYAFHDFAGFLGSYQWVTGHLRTADDYALVTRRLLERLSAENVRYAEINLSVGVMLLRKLDVAAIYESVKREAASSGVQVWWVFDAVRHFGVEHAAAVAKLAAERAGDRVVAFGIGGDEERGPAEWFADVFRYAREAGLMLVPHAGETVGPESVRAALDLGAGRIGHGIRAIEDPALVRRLRDRQIPLEVCITSNVATGVVARFEDHPLRRLFDAGVPITLNTDDPALFRATLCGEYAIAARLLGFRREELERIAANGFRFGFRAAQR